MMRPSVFAVLFLLLLAGNVRSETTLPDPEMGGASAKRPKASADRKVAAAFRRDLVAAGEKLRPIYEKYLPQLGADAMLDVVEEMAPACHAQAHDLGRAIFASSRDLATAIATCGNRCTSGCMHGVVSEALGGGSVEEVKRRLPTFCAEGAMAANHKPGNCAHALGHALMFSTGREVPESLEGCEAFPAEPMRYYCATGVFMELLVTGRRPDEVFDSLHSPCDLYPRYSAACYRFRGNDILDAFGGDYYRFAEACDKLEPGARRGCFHGLGSAAVATLFKEPSRLGAICSRGSEDDRKMCIEGAVEKLSEYDPMKAETACKGIAGGLATVCRSAAKAGMYRLDKETFPLYYDRSQPLFREPEKAIQVLENKEKD